LFDASAVDELWTAFEAAFAHSDPVVSYAPIFGIYAQRAIEVIASQAVDHVEFRMVPSAMYVFERSRGSSTCISKIELRY
jgi:hypothetical protein